MGEAILLSLWLATTIFLVCKIKRDRKSRESREWWLSDVRDCMRGIECEFQQNCEKIIEEEIARQQFNISKYLARISELEKNYKQELTEKVIARMGKYRVKSVPDTLAKEYERNISHIADTFRYFGSIIDTRKEQHRGIS